jgi:hypothetical protein
MRAGVDAYVDAVMRAALALALAVASALPACTASRAQPVADQRPGRVAGVTNVECAWDDHVDSRSVAELEVSCREDAACGCARLGHALLMNSNGAIDQRALAALDGACRRGVLVSCDEVALVAELCVRGTARPSSACDTLAREGRLPAWASAPAPPVEMRPAAATPVERLPVTAPQPE